MTDTVASGSSTSVTATTTAVSAISFAAANETPEPAVTIVPGSAGIPTLAAGTFRLPPLREVEIKLTLASFTKPPKAAKVEIFSTIPPLTGGKPVATVNATKKTSSEASGTFTFDPKKHKLTNIAFVRATADGATPLFGAIGVDAQGAFDVKWDKAGPLVRPGQAVSLQCKFVGFAPPTNAKFELFAAHEKGNKSAAAFKTLTPTEEKNVLSADFTVELPPDAPPPAEGKLADMPGIFFVVKIGSVQASSPVQLVLPDLELRFEPGDPNWVMEPIFGKKKKFKGEGQPGATDPNKNPDSKTGQFPNRVLGIKQRLQALGFYYETLPPLNDQKGRNRQTRVFRKCVRWYWKNISPGPDKKDPIPMVDEAGYDPKKDDEQPPRGPRRIDFSKIKDDWFQDLEKRVREGVIAQDPPPEKKDPPPKEGEIDFAREVKLIGPGDLQFHSQEHILGAAGAKSRPVDWTHELTAKPYDRYQLPFAPVPVKSPDHRHLMEELHYERNPSLLRVPITAVPRMKRKDGKVVDGPANGLRVLFQLVKVQDDDTKEAPYLDGLDLRATSRVVNRLGAFGSSPTPPAKAGDPPPKGPRTYVKEVVEKFKTATKSDQADPTWYNATADFGGKRDDKAGSVGAKAILPIGPDGRALGVADDDFPWSAIDATKKNGTHQVLYARSVSVPVIAGRAALVLAPSRRGGDSYRVRAFVEPPKVPGAPAPSAPPAPVGEKTTAALTVWRRLRITRYYQKKVPADWPAEAVNELGGPVENIDWTKVAELYKKAFLIVEPPPAPPNGKAGEPRELTQALRDQAVKAALAFFEKVAPRSSKGHDLTKLVKRDNGPPNTNPTHDMLRMFRHANAGAPDSPFIFDVRDQEEYNADAAGSRVPNSHAGLPADGQFPSLYYVGIARGLVTLLIRYLAQFIDEDDPPGSTDFDAVPPPGVTCLQALQADNVTGSNGAGWVQHLRQGQRLSTGSTPATRADNFFALNRSSTSGGTDVVCDYTHENGGTLRVVFDASSFPNVDAVIDGLKAGLTALGVTVPAQTNIAGSNVTNPNFDATGRLVFEIHGTALNAANSAPIGEINPSGVNSAGIPFVFTKDASGNFTGKTAPLTLADGTPAKATSSLADLAAPNAPANPPANPPWVSLDRDDGTRRTPPLPGTPTTLLHLRVLPLPAGGWSLGDLITLFDQVGCTSREVLADGSVQIKFPSAKKATKPKLVFTGTHNFFQFRREDLPGGKFRFTSEGKYSTSNAATTNLAFNEANPAATPLNVDLSDVSEGIALEPGDTLRINRFRFQDNATALAKRKQFDDIDPLDPAERTVFKSLDFVYGTGAGQDGRTLQKWCDHIQANLAKLSRDGDIVRFVPQHVFTNENFTPNAWFYFRQKAIYGKFAQDGLQLEVVVIRKDNDPDTGKPRVVRNVFPPFDPPRAVNFTPAFGTTYLPSGVSLGNATIWLFFGKDDYHNSALRGPDPAKKRGRGFSSPGRLAFSYDLATNAAHELGHLLYLRHHFTGNATARVEDHDHDDLCFMGYFTSYLVIDGKKVLAAKKEDILDGKNRDTGKTDLCGRCLLKLRGWHMGKDPKHIPQNAPAGTGPVNFPLADASFIGDWTNTRTGSAGGGGASPVPPPEPPPTPPPNPLHRSCTEVSGGHFDFDRSFVRPDGILALAKVSQELAKDATARAMIFGHTDTVGTEEYNKLLSERRAKAVLAVLTQDADAWEKISSTEGWGTKPVQIMLNAVKPEGEGPIAEDGDFGPETRGALERFQSRKSIKESGQNDAATRKVLYVEYMALAGAKVDAARFKDFGGTRAMGCSEYNPFSTTGKDEASRRVEIMIFDPKDDPTNLPCKIGNVGPCRASLLKAGESAPKTAPNGGNFKCKVYLDLTAKCPGASA